VQLYEALERVWPSPAVRVALLAARGQAALVEGGDLADVESGLRRLAEEGPSYARRDAAFALADLCWRTGRREDAAAAYRRLVDEVDNEAVRRFCRRRAEGTA
jgi:RNA polymerase sigma-70 factor (ECF subfamily)